MLHAGKLVLGGYVVADGQRQAVVKLLDNVLELVDVGDVVENRLDRLADEALEQLVLAALTVFGEHQFDFATAA